MAILTRSPIHALDDRDAAGPLDAGLRHLSESRVRPLIRYQVARRRHLVQLGSACPAGGGKSDDARPVLVEALNLTWRHAANTVDALSRRHAGWRSSTDTPGGAARLAGAAQGLRPAIRPAGLAYLAAERVTWSRNSPGPVRGAVRSGLSRRLALSKYHEAVAAAMGRPTAAVLTPVNS